MPRKLSNTYSAIHQWVRLNWGTPMQCDLCVVGKGKRFEWALKVKIPTRNREDWMRLCSACHRVLDMTGRIPWNKGKLGRQRNHNISGLIPGKNKGKSKFFDIECLCCKKIFRPKKTSNKFCSKGCATKNRYLAEQGVVKPKEGE